MGSIFRNRRAVLLSGVTGAALLCSGQAAHAFNYQFDDGVDIRFDNTIQYSVSERTSPELTSVQNSVNADDGDNDLRAGIVSNRVDLLSNLGITDGKFGFDTSVDAFYDTVYNQGTQNNDAATYNPASTPPQKFPSGTEAIAGRNIELRNLFIFGSHDIDGIPVTVRVGRFVNFYGESLLFAQNGISYGQSPIDVERASSVPNTPAKDLFLPVGQAMISAQLSDSVSVSAYYQFEWEKFADTPVGDFFSYGDLLDVGGQRIIAAPVGTPGLPPNAAGYFYRASDISGSDTGQFGAALHYDPLGTSWDFGFYALQYNDTEPQVYVHPSAVPTVVGGTAPGSPLALGLGTYQVVYADGIQIYGASTSTTLGPVNLAGEASVRVHDDLNSLVTVLPGQQANNNSHPLYAIGDTLHYQASGIYLGPKSEFFDASSIIGEAGADNLLNITENSENFDRAASKHMAFGVRAVGSVSYFEVIPGLDLSPDLGIGWNFMGEAPDTLVFNNTGIDRGGDLTLGVSATYLNKWTGGISYTRFIGPPARDAVADRDFVSFNVERTF